MIHKKYVESKAKIIKERRNATQNIASVILISGNSGSARRAALPLNYRARSNAKYPRHVNKDFIIVVVVVARYFCVHSTLILWVLNTCAQLPPHRNYLHRQDYTSAIFPLENLSSIQSL